MNRFYTSDTFLVNGLKRDKTRHLNACSRLWGLSRQDGYTTTNMEDSGTLQHVRNSCYKRIKSRSSRIISIPSHSVVRQ